MNYKIILSNKADKFYKSLDKNIKKQIKQALKDLLNYYETGEPKNLDIVKMHSDKYNDFFRIRTGSYRIIYTPHYRELFIFIMTMDKRQDVYKS